MSASNTTPTAAAVLDRVYLEVRCRLLDAAACLDRIERADDLAAIEADPRFRQLLDGVRLLGLRGDDRAERLQLLFSDSYIPNWNSPAETNGQHKSDG
jgi:hypothetical protein